MSNAPIIVTREELFRLVWTMPMTRLAERFCLTHIHLYAICDSHEIPRPSAGHWSRIAHGHKPEAPRLTSPSNPSLGQVVLKPPPKRSAFKAPAAMSEPAVGDARKSADRAFDEHLDKLIQAEARAAKIGVADSLDAAHPMVATAAKAVAVALKRPERNRQGHLEWYRHRKGKGCSIEASATSAQRALRILDALLKAWHERGCRTEPGKEEHGYSPVSTKIEDQFFLFSIREKMKQRPFNPKQDVRNEWELHNPPKLAYEPSGKLVLQAVSRDRRFRLMNLAEDGRIPLEERLNEAIVVIYRVLDGDKRMCAKARETQIASMQEEQKQREEERLRHREQARVNRLIRVVDDWHQSSRIREFVRAVRDHHDQRGSTIADEGELGRYLTWAGQVAETMDPLHEAPDSK